MGQPFGTYSNATAVVLGRVVRDAIAHAQAPHGLRRYETLDACIEIDAEGFLVSVLHHAREGLWRKAPEDSSNVHDNDIIAELIRQIARSIGS